MAVRYDPSPETLRLAVRDLVNAPRSRSSTSTSGNRMALGQRTHQLHADKRMASVAGYEPERAVSLNLDVDGGAVTLSGRLDGCWQERGRTVLEEVKLLPLQPGTLPLDGDRQQLQLYLYLWAVLHPDETLPDGRLTYVDPWQGSGDSIRVAMDAANLDALEQRLRQRLTTILTAERSEWRRLQHRAAAAKELRWPFPELRPGQDEMADATRAAVAQRRHLLIEAPTGSGKTAPILLAALDEMVRRRGRVLFVTSRTAQQADRLELLSRAASPAARGRVVMLGSRERLGLPEVLETVKYRSSDLNGDQEDSEHPNAPNFALPPFDPYDPPAWFSQLRDQSSPITSDHIRAAAETHDVDPAWLQRRLAEQADVIVADMNYLLRPHGLPAEWLLPGRKGRPVTVLVDEAHNLSDRLRDQAAGRLVLPDLATLADAVGFHPSPVQEEVITLLDSLAQRLDSRIREAADQGAGGLQLIEPDDSDFAEPLLHLRDLSSAVPVLSLPPGTREILRGLLAAAEAVTTPRLYAAYLDPAGGRVHWELMDTAARLRPLWQGLRSAVLFSATLSPAELTAAELGLPADRRDSIQLMPPVEPGSRRILRYTGISTTWRNRETTTPALAALLADCVQQTGGAWLVFFPSRAYLEQAWAALNGYDVNVTPLTPGLTPAMLRLMARDDRPTLHLTVLGGRYAEGFDPPEGFYRGAAIISLGLAPPNARAELQRLYSDTLPELPNAGYLIPALRRVRQAAGRLFRSAEQRGTLLLIDERWADPGIEAILPDDWAGSPLVTSREEVVALLATSGETG